MNILSLKYDFVANRLDEMSNNSQLAFTLYSFNSWDFKPHKPSPD